MAADQQNIKEKPLCLTSHEARRSLSNSKAGGHWSLDGFSGLTVETVEASALKEVFWWTSLTWQLGDDQLEQVICPPAAVISHIFRWRPTHHRKRFILYPVLTIVLPLRENSLIYHDDDRYLVAGGYGACWIRGLGHIGTGRFFLVSGPRESCKTMKLKQRRLAMWGGLLHTSDIVESGLYHPNDHWIANIMISQWKCGHPKFSYKSHRKGTTWRFGPFSPFWCYSWVQCWEQQRLRHMDPKVKTTRTRRRTDAVCVSSWTGTPFWRRFLVT